MKSLTLDVIFRSIGEVGWTVLFVLVITVLVEIVLYLILQKTLRYKYAMPYMLIAPAAIGISILMVYPILFEFWVAFSDWRLQTFWNPNFSVGQLFKNITDVFTKPVIGQQYFWQVFLRTIQWSVIQVTSHVVLGMGLALLLNRNMKLRGFYRAMLIVPWAVPQIIAALAWRGEFHYTYGFPNVFLTSIGLEAIDWKLNPDWNFVAMNIVNIWLGVPFMMVILLGGLQSIPYTYYEAAEMDGAGPVRKFTNVTLPLIQPVLTPAVVLGIIWTFNNFNVPFFINENELPTSDILVTALFRNAIEYSRYGYGAAFAFIIFFILLIISVFYIKISGVEQIDGKKPKAANSMVTGSKRKPKKEVTA
jgi:arabinogalactan oligomer/maltooligosaccharide transport system permease protein